MTNNLIIASYSTISEETARRAKAANSFSDYVSGSATKDYQNQVDALVEEANNKLQHFSEAEDIEQLQKLIDQYGSRLADWINRYNSNAASVPSIMISGGGNFPVRKKEKQNDREGRLWEEYNNQIKPLVGKVENCNPTAIIKSSDSNAIEKLEKRIAGLETDQNFMKDMNKYYRKHKTFVGYPELTETEAKGILSDMARFHPNAPFPSYALQNNNANIRRNKERLESLKKSKEQPTQTVYDSNVCQVVENSDIMRIQLIFDGKPSAEFRTVLKAHAFRWAPSQGAWQRQLTNNARYATKQVLVELGKLGEGAA